MDKRYFTYIDPNHVSYLFKRCYHCSKKPYIVIAYLHFEDSVDIFALCKAHVQYYNDVIQPRFFIKLYLLKKGMTIKISPGFNLSEYFLDKDAMKKFINDLKTPLE